MSKILFITLQLIKKKKVKKLSETIKKYIIKI